MINPAEQASIDALNLLFKALDDKKSFRLEAGAGAGKTYSLIKALKHLIEDKSDSLRRNNQQVACITYTNVAKEEINSRTDNNPLILADTIHAFSWSIIQGMQKQMLEFIPSISSKWKDRIDNAGGGVCQQVSYDLGYPKATETEITLHHDDVIKIFTEFLSRKKFVNILKSKYPIILIDEYQDTDKALANSIIENLIENESGIIVGFFGDHWQKIFGSKACGLIEASEGKILEIGKNANFRCEKNIVEMLNRMRPDFIQNVCDPESEGDINVFLSNNWEGDRRTDNHWQTDLPSDVAHSYLISTKNKLSQDFGWEFSPEKTKVLMLTNNVIAKEQGYEKLASVFSSNTDDYLKLNNHYIKFLIETVEEVSKFYVDKKYGEMFKSIGMRTPRLKKQSDKKSWNKDLTTLIELRKTGTIGDVIEHLKQTKRPRLSAKVEQAEKRVTNFQDLTGEEKITEQSFFDKVSAIKSIKYKELIDLSKYIDDKTPFSTKHGVKGAEFENVLIVCGRGWNNYNWNDFLTWENDGIPNAKKAAHERNRNLFYVACSRPKKRLAILFTQELTSSAMNTLNKWFITDNVSEINV